MNIARTLALAAMVALAPAAIAAPKGAQPQAVQPVGDAAADRVFKKVTELETKLKSAETALRDAKRKLDTSLGLKKGTPAKKALADLAKRSGGKVTVEVVDGKAPVLHAAEGAPEKIAATVKGANELLVSVHGAHESLKGADAEAAKLVADTAALPALDDAEKQAIQAANVARTAKLPTYVSKLSARTAGVLSGIEKTFPAHGAAAESSP